MGMYGTIEGEKVKFSSLLAEEAQRNGVVVEGGTATIHRSQAAAILASMTFAMESGRKLTEGHSIQGQSIYRLAADARVLELFFNWVVFGKDEEIFFG